MDYLSTLPVDLFIKQITYLPFSEVVSVCSLNENLHDYCTNPKYNNNWKTLIDETYGNIPNYQEMLEKVWERYGSKDVYNYMIYTDLIKTLHAVTQLTIYYRQGDMKSFSDSRYTDSQRVKVLDKFLGNKIIYGMITPKGILKVIMTNGRINTCVYMMDKFVVISMLRSINGEYYPFDTKIRLCEKLKDSLRKIGRLVDLSGSSN